MKKALLLLVCSIQFGCNYNLSKVPLSFQEGINQIPAGTVVSYQTINTLIIGPRCLECHSNAGGNASGINLETYDNVKAQLGDIKDSIEGNRMPKNRTKLPANERSVLFTWIDAGGPLTAQTTVVTPTPDPKPTEPVPTGPAPTEPTPTEPPVVFITYEKVRQEVLIPRCISCHSDAGGNRGKVNLETYSNVVVDAARIEKSIISGSMPRPKNRPLTDAQKELILKWIADGTPEL